jgi:hypothetical protein
VPAFERIGDLELANHDLRFQERTWRAERIGQVLLIAFVVLAAVGVFGVGPLSDATATAGGTTASYQRFLRLGKPADLTVTVAPMTRGPVKIALPTSYVERFDVEAIVPEPSEQATDAEALRLTFPSGTRKVTLRLTPGSIGVRSGHVTADDDVRFKQVVWP